MAKSSLPSRAPAQFHSQSLSTYDILPERSRRKQQQQQQWVAFLCTLRTGHRVMLVLVVFLLWRCSFCTSSGLVRGWTWRRQFPGTVGQVAQFQCRLFLLVQGTDIWRSCRYIGALFRALVDLPGGLRRFVPCDVGANHCRLRHIGWERCGHGLTSRPRESASEGVLNELLVLFGYPCGSAAALTSGSVTFSVLFW